jgi:Tol biopolymer transport system component
VVPAWSPDGRWIAFVRNANAGGGIFLISPDGSNEQRLLPMPFDPEGRVLNVSWSADSKELAFVRDFSHGESGNVAVLTVATGAIRNVTERSPEYHEWSPVFSPDGSRIAFYRCFRADCHINVVAKHGGPITTLTREATVIGGTLAWTADGSAVLAVRNLPDGISIWRYRDAQHAPERLYATHDHVLHLALSPDGSKLAFDSVYISENIWRWDMTQPQSRPQRFISSSRGEEFPQVSPDGRKIAFHSIRSGTWEVWVTDADGTNSRQLTHTAEGNSLYPRWSPDSRALIHDVRSHGRSTLAMIQLDSGDERRIGTGSLNAETPAFSPDGAAISFAAIQDGQSQIFLLPRDGGTPRQLTHKGGYMPSFSADGKFVFYARSFGKGGIWRIPAAGGEEELVTDKLQDRCFADWVLDESGVFYQANAEPDRARIEHLDLRTGRVREVLKLDVVAPWSDGLNVTPDGHYLLFPRPEPTQSDIMWIPLPS